MVVLAAIVSILAAALALVGPTANPVSAQATTFFSPDISITMPDIDTNVDGVHDLSGETISVSFRPFDDACNSGSEDWVVGDNGSVTRSSSVVVLVDRPVGVSSSCEYTANFPETIFDVAGVFRVVSGDGVVVSAASASVAAVL